MSNSMSSNPLSPGGSTHAAEADWLNDASLSEKWKFRFDFFEQYGVPGHGVQTAEFKAAFKALSFGERVKIGMNFYAFFFSFIYYGFFLKLWRQALIIFGIIVIANIVVVVFGLSHNFARALGIALQIGFGMRANALYYLKRTQGDIGWKI